MHKHGNCPVLIHSLQHETRLVSGAISACSWELFVLQATKIIEDLRELMRQYIVYWQCAQPRLPLSSESFIFSSFTSAVVLQAWQHHKVLHSTAMTIHAS